MAIHRLAAGPTARANLASFAQPAGPAAKRPSYFRGAKGDYTVVMELDDEVCLCFHVTKRKLVNFLRVERPRLLEFTFADWEICLGGMEMAQREKLTFVYDADGSMAS